MIKPNFWLKILALCPEHPKRDQNPKFTSLSETTSIPSVSYGRTAEQEFIRTLAKFHQRCIEHLQSKRPKVEQELSREKNKTNVFQTRKSRTPSAPQRDENLHMSTDVLKLASNIQAKIDKFTQLLSKIDDSKNKQSESYPSVLSASKGGRGKGTKRNTLTVRNYKRRARKNTLQRKKSKETIELRKQHQKPLRHTIDYRADQFTLSRFEIHSNTCHERKPDKAPANFRLQPTCQKDAPSIYLS